MKSLCIRLLVVFCFFSCPHFLFAQLPSYLPADGLVAWYPFNGNANDESGNGNNGMLGNVIAANGRNGDALGAFSMNNSSIQLSSNIKVLNNQSYTIGAWVKLNSAEETWLFSQRDYYGYNGAEVLFESNTVWPYYGQQNSTHQWQNLTPEGIPYYNFQFITCVINKSSNELLTYVNGILTGSFSISGISNVENTSTAVIGRKPTSNGNCSFIIDEFFFYDRALTVNEIADVYQNSLPVQQFSSAPPGIPYQAEVRNESGEVLANANVNARFTLHELTANGTASYQETHALTTNELGLFAATIGAGTATQGTFAGINWAQTTKFLQVEVDAGNGYVTMGNQQLMSVPYALYAANGPAGPQGPVGPQGPAGADGQPGAPGANGLSAYEVWLAQGNNGTEADFLQNISNQIHQSIAISGTQSYSGSNLSTTLLGTYNSNEVEFIAIKGGGSESSLTISATDNLNNPINCVFEYNNNRGWSSCGGCCGVYYHSTDFGISQGTSFSLGMGAGQNDCAKSTGYYYKVYPPSGVETFKLYYSIGSSPQSFTTTAITKN